MAESQSIYRPDYRRVDSEAMRLLRAYDVQEPPVDPVEIARGEGVDVVFAGFDARHDHISGFYDFQDQTIYVNRDEYPLRQTFTVAHELGHSILHEDWARSENYRVLPRDTSLLAQQANDPREKEANAFAACLLTPRFLMDQYWGDLSPSELSRLFAVSVPMIKNRLSFLYGV